jgi:anti-anti-sigma factor
LEEAIYYREVENILYVRLTGHITAAPCADLRNRVYDRFQKQPLLLGIFVDMTDCEYMDSTFMGLLVGFNKRLEKARGKKVTLFNINKTCFELLDNLGVSTLINFSSEAVAFPADMEKLEGPRQTNPEFLLNVHENLMELSDDNKKKFQTLGSVLKNEIEKKRGGE